MLLNGKKIVVLNIANKRSIAWAIAQALDQHGAELVLGYQNERTKDNVVKLSETLSKPPIGLVECDVTSDEQIVALEKFLEEKCGVVDGLVHCLAFAPKEALERPYIETSRQAFSTALEISTYSLVALSRACQKLFSPSASVLTLTYFGAEKVVTNYNVMGVAKAALEASVRYLANDLGPQQVRVNAISAGPLNTLAARGISHFVDVLDLHKEKTPLKRNIEAKEVADTAVFLLSELSTGITGEVIHVDAGYNIMGI